LATWAGVGSSIERGAPSPWRERMNGSTTANFPPPACMVPSGSSRLRQRRVSAPASPGSFPCATVAMNGSTSIGRAQPGRPWAPAPPVVMVGSGCEAGRGAPLLCWDRTIGSAIASPPSVVIVGSGSSAPLAPGDLRPCMLLRTRTGSAIAMPPPGAVVRQGTGADPGSFGALLLRLASITGWASPMCVPFAAIVGSGPSTLCPAMWLRSTTRNGSGQPNFTAPA